MNFDADELDIDAALEVLRERGLIVIRRAVRRDLAVALQARLVGAWREVAERDAVGLRQIRTKFLGSPGHIGILLGLSGEVIDKEVLLPAGVSEVMTRYLGRDLYLHEWVDNINHAANPNEQKAHRDDDIDLQGRPCGLVLNVATQVIDMTNGMTCFWLDSHRAPFDQNADPAGNRLAFERFQPALDVGDVILRELALLHKGVANADRMDRHLTAMVFNPAWQPINPKFVREIPSAERTKLDAAVQGVLRHHRSTDALIVQSSAYPIPAPDG